MTTGRFSWFFFSNYQEALSCSWAATVKFPQQFVLSIAAHSHLPFQQSGVSLTRCPPLCALTIIFRLWRWCHYVGGRLPHPFCLPSPPLPIWRRQVSRSQPLIIMMSFHGRGGAPRQGSESSNSTRVTGYFLLFFFEREGRKEGRKAETLVGWQRRQITLHRHEEGEGTKKISTLFMAGCCGTVLSRVSRNHKPERRGLWRSVFISGWAFINREPILRK